MGAQTTVQRWWADPLLNAQGEDRTIRTVFTHDHFGPSTHQQVGLYAGLVIEPTGSTWRHPETGAIMGGRFDGGPTSFRADILTADPKDSHREFMLEFQDFTLAYTADNVPINPPNREEEAGLPFVLEPGEEPEPEGVSANQVGTFSVNYRSEPIALRIRDPFNSDADGSNGVQAPGFAGDLALAYRSDVTRADPALNVQPGFYPPLTADVHPGDPFTPLLRAYEGDDVHIRILNGATKDGHNFSIHGLRWLHEPDSPHSGYRNAQMSAISEHFEFELGELPEVSGHNNKADFLYQPGASTDDQWNGMWGILREYEGLRSDLLPLPNNSDGRLPSFDADDFQGSPTGVCPKGAPLRTEFVAAVQADRALPEEALFYNEGHELRDPAALMYVRLSDLNPFTGKLKNDAPREPLILRAAAGDCIKVVLFNFLTWNPPDLLGFMVYPMVVNFFNANQVHPSPRVGLHPQLVHYDVRTDNGVDVGFNPGSTAPPGGFAIYQWYAGTVEIDKFGKVIATPVEFGAVNLMPADLLQHAHKGLVGSLIVEPKGSSWSYPDEGTRATADVSFPGGSFREFVMVFQDDVQVYLDAEDAGGGDDDDLRLVALRYKTHTGEGEEEEEIAPMLIEAESPQDSGNRAINYRMEPMWVRAGVELGEAEDIGDLDLAGILSIAEAGEIETPLFEAPVGTPVRFRVLEPQGHPRNHTISIQGHTWRHEPGNPNGDFIGSQGGHGPASHWDIVPLHGAGGAFGVPGDYLYRDHATGGFNGGIWGVFRVTEDPGVAQE
jgi:hypothetical protein